MGRPDFLIVGERRSGTSTLAKWIEAHPNIWLDPQMDKAFFLDNILRGRRQWLDGKVDLSLWLHQNNIYEYFNLFNLEGVTNKLMGEKSADYFFWEPSLDRIKRFLPDVKIIITLRHPVERSWSHYWNEVGKGREWLSFEEAIATESLRMAKSDYAKLHLSYLERSKYILTLNNCLRRFPVEQIHIIILENLIKNPLIELEKVYSFLGVDQSTGFDRAGIRFNHNWTTVPYDFWQKNKILRKTESQINILIKRFVKFRYGDINKRKYYSPKLEMLTRRSQKQMKMNQETRENLLNLFEPFNTKLEKELNLNLNDWRK